MIHPSARVHATADIEDDVDVGPRTSVWHRAQLRAGARVGADCIIGRDAFIDVGVLIGDRVKIQNAALVYHGTTVEDGVFIGPNAILTNDRYPRSVTSTGDLAGPGDWEVGQIALREGCSIGAGAIVVAGSDVGRYAMVGAGAVVTRTVTDHALVAGNPARRLGWLCACGSRLTEAASDEVAPPDPHPGAELMCAACDRRWVYVADAESIEEVTQPADRTTRQGTPA